MLKKIIITLVFFLCFTASNTVTAQSNLKKGLIAYYPFNGNAKDESGNGLNGKLNGCSSIADRFGNKNSAYSFNGTTDYISVPFDSLLNLTTDKSFSFWYKISSGTISPYATFIQMQNASGVYYPTFQIQLTEEYGYKARRYKINFFFGKASTNYELTTKELYSNYIDKWVHIGATYSQSSGYQKIYFNGKLSDSINIGNITSNSSTSDLQIGRGGTGSYGTGTYFKGEMDELRVYNRELDSNEIGMLYDLFIEFPTIKNLSVCAGDSLKILYNKKHDLDTSNILTFQLSDSVGSFDHFKTIKTINQFKKGLDSISVFIPNNYFPSNSYRIRLVASSQKDTMFINSVSINAIPLNTYSLIGSNVYCKNDTSEIIVDNKIVSDSYFWYRNDTIISGKNNYKLKPISSGIYKVKIISEFGCVKISKDTSITIFPQPIINVVLSSTYQCLVGNKLTFQNNTSIVSGKINYEWNFGDSTTSSMESPIKTYSYADSFKIKLKTVTDKNCSDSVNYLATIFPNPISSFTINNDSQCHVGNRFIFKNQSTITSGLIYYNWELGDSTFSNSNTSITKTYKDTGTYKVKLFAVSNQNCKDSLLMPVVVFSSPKANFITNNYIQCLNENIFLFTDNSTLDNGTYSSFWTFNDSTFSKDLSPLKIYNKEGNYTVMLEVITNQNCKDIASQFINVLPSPIASYSLKLETQCFKNNNFQFQNTSSITNGTNSYYWDFNDNTSSTQISPSKKYNQEGVYKIVLIANANNNCSDTLYDTISVLPSPNASFTINKDKQCAKDDLFKMTNQSTLSNGNIMFEWAFGDGDTSSIKNTEHYYENEGKFIIKLRTISNDNCTDSFQKIVQVYEKPIASFIPNKSSQCLNENQFVFFNTSTYRGNNFKTIWDFGNGAFDTLSSANNKYLDTGIFSVKLILITENSCTDTAVRDINILSNPESLITSINNNICSGDTINFKILFYNNQFKYKWLKDERFYGDTSETLKVNQKLDIKLISINKEKCTDTSDYITTIYKALPNQPIITRTNRSLNIDSGYSSYQWYLNNQRLNGETNPIVEISLNGNYNVRVTNADDCAIESNNFLVDYALISKTFQNNISVYPNPTHGKINIECELASSIEIYDLQGRLVKSISKFELNHEISFENMEAAIYLIKIITEKGLINNVKISLIK